MKFNKKLKKGFTLVELIVVIAIVAILAAVSVVSYLAFINSANESADIQLVKQLNTCLQADEALHGKKDWSEDYQGLRDLLEGNGFIVENLTKTKSGCDMVYQGKIDDDHIINRYALLNGDKVIYSETTFAESNNCRNLWIPETAKEAQDLSDEGKGVVLGEELGHIDTFNAKGSVIVSGANVNEINYSNPGASQKVVISTNGGTLKIDAGNDKVSHYGVANEVDIKAVAPTSYVENGIVSIAKIKTGRIVVTPEAVLTSIHAVETNGNYNNIKVAVVGNAELPGFTRDEVTMNDGDKKLVIEVQSIATLEEIDETPEYIWISKNAGTTSTDVATSATTLDETTKVPVASQSTTAKAVANDVAEGTTAEQLAEMEAVATRYAGGQGTESNPYLLATKTHFGSIDEDYHNGVTEGKFYKLVADLDLGKIYPIGSMSLVGNAGTASQGYTITYTDTFKGNIDGNNHTIAYTMITDDGLANGSNSIGLFGAIEKAVIKNLTINANITGTRNSVWVGGLAGFGWYCDLENITINGSVTGKHDVGGFFGYYSNEGINTTNKFKNCVNNATITCNSGRSGDNYAICGGFIGQLSVDDSSSYNEYSLIFENCQSNGSITIGTTTAANSAASYFVGFASDNAANKGKNISFVFNHCSVGNDASFSSTKGDTRTKSNHTIYCGSSDAAITACPAIKYVGVTSNLWAVNPANGANVKVVVNDAEQDMSLYFVQ